MIFVSGVDLLKGQPVSQKVHAEDSPHFNVWNLENNTDQHIIQTELRKFSKRGTRELTLEIVGFSTKHTYSTLFGIYLKHKKLPLIEINLDIRKRKIILRYQGVRSFQRVIVSAPQLDNWKVMSFSVNRTHFTANIGCKHESSVRLRQMVNTIPMKAFAVVGRGKKGEDPFVVSFLNRNAVFM